MATDIEMIDKVCRCSDKRKIEIHYPNDSCEHHYVLIPYEAGFFADSLSEALSRACAFLDAKAELAAAKGGES